MLSHVWVPYKYKENSMPIGRLISTDGMAILEEKKAVSNQYDLNIMMTIVPDFLLNYTGNKAASMKSGSY